MSNRTIIFRADGNPTIGLGHFIRTLALAEMLKDNFHCIFATQLPTEFQIREIEKICHERINLPADETHFIFFLNLLNGDEIVVLDNYYFSTAYQIAIKAKGCKLVCIDDMHNKHFVANLIINHAVEINKSQYSAEKYTTYCLGYKFALLRYEYLSKFSNKITKRYACLLMIGGSDPLNLTAKIVTMIKPMQFHLPIAVIIGADSNFKSPITHLNNIELFRGIESSKVYQLMHESHFGIFPASTVAIEACAVRLPFICGYFVDNQKEFYYGIKKYNLALCIGNFLQIASDSFIRALEQLSQKSIVDGIVHQQKKMLDKKSKGRFIKTFNQIWKLESGKLY